MTETGEGRQGVSAQLAPVYTKLIEVALPLEAINRACKAEKDRKTGTIRNLHKWFAPMPSPAWRALLAAALLDDPGDANTRTELLGLLASLVDEAPDVVSKAVTKLGERLKENGCPLPVVFDPFCGGGSTLIEAQKLGCRAFGSDLNPIPVLISTLLTHYLPAFAWRRAAVGQASKKLFDSRRPFEGFETDVSHYARRIYEEAQVRIGNYFPKTDDGDRIVAWWWARTVPSPDPRFQGCPTPLVNDWWLSKRKGSETFVRPLIDIEAKRINFEVVLGRTGAPRSSKSRCLYSGTPISFDYIKAQGQAGRLGVALLAVVAQGRGGRKHLAPTEAQVVLASSAVPKAPPAIEASRSSPRIPRTGVRYP